MTAEENKILLTLSCPNCGGQIQTSEGEDMVVCKYCDSVLTLTSDEGIGRVMYKMNIFRDEAVATYQEWLGKGPKAKDLRDTAKISEVYPVYLPFWRLRGRGKACVCGIEERQVSDGKTTHTERIPRESLVNREFVYTKIACESGDLGIETLSLPANAEATLYSDEDIATFQVTKSRSDAYNAGIESIKQEAISIGGKKMKEINFSRAFFFPTSFSLIYYPIWVIRYKYQDRDYMAAVDAIASRILSGRAPGNIGSQSTAAAVGGTISGALIASPAVTVPLIFNNMTGDIGFLVGAVVVIPVIAAVFLLRWCFKRFRYGGEVSEGSIKGKTLNVGKEQKEAQSVPGTNFDYFH